MMDVAFKMMNWKGAVGTAGGAGRSSLQRRVVRLSPSCWVAFSGIFPAFFLAVSRHFSVSFRG